MDEQRIGEIHLKKLSRHFEDWALAHENNWYLKTLEFLGRVYEPILIEEDLDKSSKENTRKKQILNYRKKIYQANSYHGLAASDCDASGRGSMAEWHRFCKFMSDGITIFRTPKQH